MTTDPPLKNTWNSAAPRLWLPSRADTSWWIGASPDHFTARAEAEVERMRRGVSASAVAGVTQ